MYISGTSEFGAVDMKLFIQITLVKHEVYILGYILIEKPLFL